MLVVSNRAQAQFSEDMWTGQMKAMGLFQPHVNNCDSTMVFVSMGPGANLGYCMEKDERTAAIFDVARQTCLSNGTRLPEPVEFKTACLAAPSGLVHMTNGWEWASNYTLYFYNLTGEYAHRVSAVVAGRDGLSSGNSCYAMGTQEIGTFKSNDGESTFVSSNDSLNYRCVR
jgi:hypothetical protein